MLLTVIQWYIAYSYSYSVLYYSIHYILTLAHLGYHITITYYYYYYITYITQLSGTLIHSTYSLSLLILILQLEILSSYQGSNYNQMLLTRSVCVGIGGISQISSNDWQLTIQSWEQYNLCLYQQLGSTSTYDGQAISIQYIIMSTITTYVQQIVLAQIYGIYGTSNYDYIRMCSSSSSMILPEYQLILPIVFKLGQLPLHSWLPDILQSLPWYLNLWFILLPKCITASFILVLGIDHILSYLVILGILSIQVGSIGMANQILITRLLAYSSIAYIGQIVIAQYHHTIFLLAQQVYLFTMLILGYTINILYYDYVVISVLVFSQAGLPPQIGFISKQYVLISQITWSHVTTIIVIQSSILSASNYISLVRYIGSYGYGYYYITNCIISHLNIDYLYSLSFISGIFISIAYILYHLVIIG